MDGLAIMFGFREPSYGEKLSGAMCGLCLGLVLFWGGLGTAAWNEYDFVAKQQTLEAGQKALKQANCTSNMDPSLEGQLVHVSCPISNLGVLGQGDPVLQGIADADRTGLYVESFMQVYGWIEHSYSETTKVSGGSTRVTTYTYYTYDRQWGTFTPEFVGNFSKQGETCKAENYGNQCVNWDPKVAEPWWNSSSYELGTAQIDISKNVKVGNYTLPESAITTIGSPKVLEPKCANMTDMSCAPGTAKLDANTHLVWQQKDSDGNMVDYLQRTYTIYSADAVSILAQQSGDTFVAWESPYDETYDIFIFTEGTSAAADMFLNAQAENLGVVWFLRFFTLMIVIVGLVMVTVPLTVVPDIIPCIGPYIGDLFGYVLWAVDCCFGCCCWSFVVAIAWLWYRPKIGIPLLIVSILLCLGGSYVAYLQKGKGRPTAAAAATAGGDDPDKKVEEDLEVAAAASGGGDDPDKKVEEDLEVAEEYDPAEGKA